jgi:hypothetical protein
VAASGEDIFHKLRGMALTMTAKKLGVPQDEPVVGVVMDLSFDGGFASVTSFLTGEASIYLSSGGGSIGGGAHASIQKAAKAFVAEAAKALPLLKPAIATPLPVHGKTAFYVITPKGLFTASEREQMLGEKRSELSPLFYAGQNVITAYRAWQDTPKHH